MKSFISPVTVISGPGSIARVPEEINKFGASKVMIFADPGIVKIGLVNKLENLLAYASIEYVIYSDLEPEPPLEVGDRALQALRESQADFVIGMGGGSSLDIAKAVAVLSANDGRVQDYLNLTGTKQLTNKGLPKMLIPTTSGTGAEVTDIAVFSLETTKDVITQPLLLADIAIVDPELTYTLPPSITASTGIDALTHAVEAFISVNATPLTDALAIDAIERIAANIRTAVWDGANMAARQELSWGSLMAGLSFYNAGVSGVHALAYPLGGLFKLPHGVSNAVMLPYVFDYIWPSCMKKMARMAQALGVNSEHLSVREAAIAAVQALNQIVLDTGVPRTLKDYQIKREDIETLASEGIKQKRLLARSPKPYTIDDIRNVYLAAFEGSLQLGT
ncbi:iron-containing alcohol dehydrogenase [Neobacillus muris]|uniref:iron-containing alcohol dehydrogenase n=1 Tax=Neobacillus muris TaxID=2941334 RepID=UPI00203E276F|nr:iron-containing alcohol dehydrogenase [Neobacillus muris]